jgi:hypothetical protein
MQVCTYIVFLSYQGVLELVSQNVITLGFGGVSMGI